MNEVKKVMIKDEKEGKEESRNTGRKEIKENVCAYCAGRKRSK
jgi:hypothetical protein